MLVYSETHDASVSTMDDVFTFSGGFPRERGNHYYSGANPFDDEDEESFNGRSSTTTTTTTRTTTKYKKKYDGGQSSEEDRECSICLDTIHSAGDARMLVCAHTFHSDCVEEWLARSNVCPLCRTQQ
jgi:hypothetical protein